MKQIIQLIALAFLLFSCNDKAKESNQSKSTATTTNEIVAKPLEVVFLPAKEHWKFTNTSLRPASLIYQSNELYFLESVEIGKSTYVALDNIKIPDVGGLYEISFIIGSTTDDSSFGFRIQEVYPNRVDVAFNLKDQTVIGVDKIGDFIFEEKAKIDFLEDNLYKCTINAEIYSNYVRILFGPSANNPKVLSWESPKGKQESVYIIPESLKFNLIAY